ncbi:hypothetical protein [Pseudonocardia sp. ICBG601]|uniref:hypothetical protein n=1 Tax=Pseudonocardia sp. ICBG601 TaxID=2846759 RepID=UPI001CF67A62|nr:hypothetical protein [Pseudonocardia sp. ICBG601]
MDQYDDRELRRLLLDTVGPDDPATGENRFATTFAAAHRPELAALLPGGALPGPDDAPPGGAA